MWRLLPAAVLVELGFDVSLIVHAIQNHIEPNISSGVGRVLVMGTLGGLAVFRGARWARLIFAGVLYFGAAGLFLASIVPIPFVMVPRAGFHFEPAVFAFSVGYVLVAIAATVGGRAMEARGSARGNRRTTA